MDPASFGRGRGTESGEHVIINTQCWEGGGMMRKTIERDSEQDRKKSESEKYLRNIGFCIYY